MDTPANQNGPALALSIEEVLKATPVGRTTLYGEIAAGRLKARRIGRRTVILASDLNAWLASLAVA